EGVRPDGYVVIAFDGIAEFFAIQGEIGFQFRKDLAEFEFAYILTRFKLQLALAGDNPDLHGLNDDVNDMQTLLEASL
ncbi:hypothetical protein ACC739_38165, partial [Rhizobium ruizarguesonis]